MELKWRWFQNYRWLMNWPLFWWWPIFSAALSWALACATMVRLWVLPRMGVHARLPTIQSLLDGELLVQASALRAYNRHEYDMIVPFTGEPLDWQRFDELFVTAYHLTNLPDAFKMERLKAKFNLAFRRFILNFKIWRRLVSKSSGLLYRTACQNAAILAVYR